MNSSGYGHLYVDGIHHYAHVYYYEQAHGVVEGNGRRWSSRQVHHRCGNKLCVNPEHLEASGVEDHRRAHGIVRLTREVVEQMRREYARGDSQKALQERYGMSQSHTSGILTGRYWK